MKPEQQRIAIAEACGWRDIKRHGYYWTGTRPRQPMEDDAQYMMALPDYLNDLNAMHEAEKVLEDRRVDYVGYLEDTTRHHLCTDNLEIIKWRFISATAAQRAEAFLRTIGKWEDTNA